MIETQGDLISFACYLVSIVFIAFGFSALFNGKKLAYYKMWNTFGIEIQVKSNFYYFFR